VHEVLVNRKPHMVKILERDGNLFLIEVNKKTVKVRLKNSSEGKMAMMEIDGNTFQANVERTQANLFQIRIGAKTFEVEYPPKIPDESRVKAEPLAVFTKKPILNVTVEKDAVTAPIAGRIVLLRTKAGERVERGKCICILEAMKMENEISAPKSGVVKEVRVSEGAVVSKGDVVAVIS